MSLYAVGAHRYCRQIAEEFRRIFSTPPSEFFNDIIYPLGRKARSEGPDRVFLVLGLPIRPLLAKTNLSSDTRKNQMKNPTEKDSKYGFGRLIDLARAEPLLVKKHVRPGRRCQRRLTS